MFTTYDNQPDFYIPDNMHLKPLPPINLEVDNESLHGICRDGRFYGYWWKYGDSIKIPISANLTISVDSHSFIYDVPGECPSMYQPGFVGQKAYNIVDVQSWTMIRYVPETGMYLWAKDEKLTYPSNGELSLEIMPNMKGKKIVAQIVNFRKEEIFKFEFCDMNKCFIELDKEKSSKLLRGNYYLIINYETDTYSKQTDYYELWVQ